MGAGALWRRDAGQDSTSIIPVGEEPAASDTRQTDKARRVFVTTSGATMFGLSLPMHRHLQARYNLPCPKCIALRHAGQTR